MIDTALGALIEVMHSAQAQAERAHQAAMASNEKIIEAAARVPARWRAFAACVEPRESGGNPRAVNESSGAAGLFQFMPGWRGGPEPEYDGGLPYVVARALKFAGMAPDDARAIRLKIQNKPIHRYPEMLQRAGFAQVLREGGRAAAMRHWWLDGSRCNALMPSH